MTKTPVISRSYLPTSLPLVPTIVAYLLMDKLNAPMWLQGAVYTVFALLWIVCITVMICQKPTTPKFEE